MTAEGPHPQTQRVLRGSRVPSSPAVSIIVLVTDDTARVQRCLESISARSESGPVAEVIVLANGTPANALEPLTSRDDIVLVRSAVNHGFGGGCNWAARFALGRRLVFVNDDAIVTPGWLIALDAAIDDDSRIGVAGSRVLLRDGRLQEAGDVIWRDGSTSHLGRGLPGDDPAMLNRRDVDYVSFCSAMVRRETWDEVGGFDERYFPAYYEDADFCLTARTRGWRVVCEAASVVIHEEGGSTPVPLRHFLSHRNQEIFVSKWGFRARPVRRATGASRHPRGDRGCIAEDLRIRHHAWWARSRFISHRCCCWWQTAIARTAHAGPESRRRGEEEALAVELRHLADDVALKEEYIQFLGTELDGYGAADLARRRYRMLRGAVGRRLRRHPRAFAAVEAIRARIGGRTSQ